MTVLVSIHSGFRMWTIPAGARRRLRARFPATRFLHARDDEEGRAPDRRGRRRVRLAHHTRPAAGGAARCGGFTVPRPASATCSIRRWSPARSSSPTPAALSAETMAEHVIAVVLALFRRLPLAFERQAQRTLGAGRNGGARHAGVPVTAADRHSAARQPHDCRRQRPDRRSWRDWPGRGRALRGARRTRHGIRRQADGAAGARRRRRASAVPRSTICCPPPTSSC